MHALTCSVGRLALHAVAYTVTDRLTAAVKKQQNKHIHQASGGDSGAKHASISRACSSPGIHDCSCEVPIRCTLTLVL